MFPSENKGSFRAGILKKRQQEEFNSIYDEYVKTLTSNLNKDLSDYELVVCFDDTSYLSTGNNFKTLNVHETLTQSNFFHRLTKYGLSLDVLESVLCDKTIDCHDMLLYYASENKDNELKTSMQDEATALYDIYHYFYKS